MHVRRPGIARRLDSLLMIAASLTIPEILLQRLELPDPWRTATDVLNWAIWLTFLSAAAVMLSVAPSKWRWLREHPLDVAIVLFTPPFISNVVTSLEALRVLRLLPLLRLGPLVPMLISAEGLQYAALLALLTGFAGGAAFASIEHTSIGNGVYWAIATMTTVGYGDVVPTTAGGRDIAVVVMLVGTGFYALVIGAIAERFATGPSPTSAKEPEPGLTDDDLLKEIREISARLERVERSLAQHRSDQ